MVALFTGLDKRRILLTTAFTGPAIGTYRVGQRNPEVSLNRLGVHMRQKIGGESHAPGLPVHLLSIGTTFLE